ncbi:MAG: response regulator [Oceanospirillaceae bacterium]|nr:response regulator [Oceanospirillaceae bacterium]
MNNNNKLSKIKSSYTSSIGRKLLIYVMMISGLFTLLIAIVQIIIDYNYGISEIDSQIQQISINNITSISNSLWQVDMDQLTLIVEGIAKLPNIEKVVIIETQLIDDVKVNETVMLIGEMKNESDIIKRVPLTYANKNQQTEIGELVLYVSLSGLYQSLIDKFIVIVLLQGVKTFIVSLFILWMFYYLVTRHLIVMSVFSRDISFDNLEHKLILDRKSSARKDEIAWMEEALNETKDNLKRLLDTNETALKLQSEIEQSSKREELQQLHQRELEKSATKTTHANKLLTQEVEQREATQVELQQAKIDAEDATKAKSDFLAKMSHEIRTPMNAVIGLSRLVLKTPLQHQQRDYIEKVLDSGEALLGLINDILDFSKIEAGKLSIENHDFNLSKLLQRSVNLSAMNAHAKGLELVVNVDKNLPLVLNGDSLRLQQVIVNLVNNAVKFTEKGCVCINIAMMEESEKRLVLRFSVVDTGMGISEKQQSKMFQSFSQADESVTRKFGGTGLGLSISKQLCELMGGKIWLDSEVGVGSSFHFTVSLGKTLQPETSLKASNCALEKLKVLIVDDIKMARAVLVDLLAGLGIKAEQTDNGAQCIEMIKEAQLEGVPFDLVLMDWRMPEMDGIETSNKIHEAHLDNSPHILMVSAYDKDEARAHLDESVIQQFLEKPVNEVSLRHILLNRFGVDQDSNRVVADTDQSIPNLSSFHILLVEDNAINRQVALGYLQDTKIKVDIAEDGLLAIEKIKAYQYDLVLMDIQMPNLDGLSATQYIRKDLNMLGLPIIAMTAHAMQSDVEKSLAAGMNLHICKPIDPDLLIESILTYLTPAVSVVTTDIVLPVPSEQQPNVLSSNNTGNDKSVVLTKLNQISLLDCNKAIVQMQGRETLYLELIQNFCLEQQLLGAKMQQSFTAQDQQTLYRLAHSLKSNAAYIGAFDLSVLSTQLEKSLAQGDWNARLLSQVITELEQIISALLPIFITGEEHVENIDFSIDWLKSELVELIPLLESSDFSVEASLASVHKSCMDTEYGSVIAQICESVEDIEYEHAALVAIKLLKELKEVQL